MSDRAGTTDTEQTQTRDAAARNAATTIGATAILLWSTLAMLTAWSGTIPPFQLLAITFTVAGSIGVVGGLFLGRDVLAALRQPWKVWGIGVAGLFGYHFFYFLAIRLAPQATVEVNLLNYLWPLLIVVFSALLPGERLRWFHLAGALAGLSGTALIITGRVGGVTLSVDEAPGYLSALACALLWSSYSVLSRRIGADAPTDAVAWFCLVTALLSALCHLAFETTVSPTATEWAAAVLLGLGPVGAAFFVWDHGVKKGDIQLLGALAYAAPLMSTLLLVITGTGQGGAHVWGAAALIVGGALLASRDMVASLLRGRRKVTAA